jgi:hypothetical protein
MSVCLLCVGTDKNCNFSAVRSPIELKLSGGLGLVSQISVHVLVSRFDCFSYCKQGVAQQAAKLQPTPAYTSLLQSTPAYSGLLQPVTAELFMESRPE